jgi:hypothetical protein
LKGPLAKRHIVKCFNYFTPLDQTKSNKAGNIMYEKYDTMLDDLINEREFIEEF